MLSLIIMTSICYLTDGFNALPQKPVVCHYSDPPSVYELNHTLDCKNLFNQHLKRYQQNATLFKLNLNKYNTKVWSCQKLKRIDVIYKSFGPIYKLGQRMLSLVLTAEECRQMVETKICIDGENFNPLYYQSEDIWTTNISSVINAKTFQIKSYNVTNCFLSIGSVWINRLTGRLESNLGSLAHCQYANGSCNLSDHRMLVWNTHPDAKCTYLPWKSVTGYFENNNWFSMENEPTVLTLGTKFSTLSDGCGHTFYKSEQGIGIMTADVRKKRNADETSGYNPVTQAELNMKLQGIVSQLLTSPDVNGFSVACALAEELVYSWHVDLYKNPTLTIRRILRNPYIKAETRGRAVFIWSCTPVDSYSVLPMNDMCTNLVPITFTIDIEDDVSAHQLFGYLEPSTNEILSSASEANCEQIDPIVLELNYTFFWYSYKYGMTPYDQKLPNFSSHFLTTLTISRNNTNSLLSSIIYKTGSAMYNRSEYIHFVDMNEMHRYMEHEKLRSTMFKPLIKLREFMNFSISLPDLKTSLGELFSGLSTWWLFLYWFAVCTGVIFLLFLVFKIVCVCKKLFEFKRNRVKTSETFV